MDTNWKPVVGFEDSYEVSSEGEIRSKTRVIKDSRGRYLRYTPRTLRPSTGEWGHKRVNLHSSQGGKPKTRTVHSIVLEAFVGPRPEGFFGCHNDGNPGNNAASNLRWATPRENMLDKSDHGTDHQRNKMYCPLGHRLSEPNLQSRKSVSGWRSCRSCHQARSDQRNGSTLTFKESADLRYEMILRGQRFRHGTRKVLEVQMYRELVAGKGETGD